MDIGCASMKRLRCHLWLHQYEQWEHPNAYWDDIIEEWACVWCEADYMTSWRFRFGHWLWSTRIAEAFIDWEYRRAERRGDFDNEAGAPR